MENYFCSLLPQSAQLLCKQTMPFSSCPERHTLPDHKHVQNASWTCLLNLLQCRPYSGHFLSLRLSLLLHNVVVPFSSCVCHHTLRPRKHFINSQPEGVLTLKPPFSAGGSTFCGCQREMGSFSLCCSSCHVSFVC